MRRHLILCTNNQTLVEFISAVLDGGPRITVSDSGLQVLAAVDVVHADLLVLDLEMPGLNPLLLTSAIRALAPSLPILAVSGRAPEDGRALSHKGVSHVSLPADRRGWEQALANTLESLGLSSEKDRHNLPTGVGGRIGKPAFTFDGSPEACGTGRLGGSRNDGTGLPRPHTAFERPRDGRNPSC
jgi:CheY-like chemotaxis protein